MFPFFSSRPQNVTEFTIMGPKMRELIDCVSLTLDPLRQNVFFFLCTITIVPINPGLGL